MTVEQGEICDEQSSTERSVIKCSITVTAVKLSDKLGTK